MSQQRLRDGETRGFGRLAGERLKTYGSQPGAGSLLLGSGHCDW